MTRERGVSEEAGFGGGAPGEGEIGPELVSEPMEVLADCRAILGVSGAESEALGRIVRIWQLDRASERVVERHLRTSPYSLASGWSEVTVSKALMTQGFVLFGVFGENGELNGFAVGVCGAKALQALSPNGATLLASEFEGGGRRAELFSEQDGFILGLWVDEKHRRHRLGTALMFATMAALREEGATRAIAFVRYEPRRVGDQVFGWDKLYSDLLKRLGMRECGTLHFGHVGRTIVFIYGRDLNPAPSRTGSGALEVGGVGRGEITVNNTLLSSNRSDLPAAK